MTKTDFKRHKLLTIWAADCAEHVLYIFENNHKDDRPRKAIEAARAWVRGETRMTEVRKLAFTAHAAARVANSQESIAVARATGHAAATAHVPHHAKYAAFYALKAVKDTNTERERQTQNLPENCKSIIDLDYKKNKLTPAISGRLSFKTIKSFNNPELFKKNNDRNSIPCIIAWHKCRRK